jgi:hypothetical protein
LDALNKEQVEKWQKQFMPKNGNQDTFFQVPDRYLISVDTVMNDSFGQQIAQNGIELDPEILIALYLIKQKHTNSLWKEFLGTEHNELFLTF